MAESATDRKHAGRLAARAYAEANGVAGEFGSPRRAWVPEIVGSCAAIPLFGGRQAFVDVPDLALVAPFAWSLLTGSAGSVYAVGRAGPHRTLMHILLAQPPFGLLVDHWDRDGLNNRRSNLREATKSQNSQNGHPGRRGMTPYKGVAFHRHSGLWHATITKDGRQTSLQYHKTPAAAAQAYDRAAIELFGTFALTNEAMGKL